MLQRPREHARPYCLLPTAHCLVRAHALRRAAFFGARFGRLPFFTLRLAFAVLPLLVAGRRRALFAALAPRFFAGIGLRGEYAGLFLRGVEAMSSSCS